jgi:tetratricopeptide (TPR) repeat protein
VFPQAPVIRCREGLENLPFYPVLEYLKTRLDKLPDLGPYREDLARLLPEVWPGFTPPPAEPITAKARLLEALTRALAQVDPIIFDDLQWADEGTLELFLSLSNQDKRLMATYRTHEVGASLNKALEALRSKGGEAIALQPLSSHAVQTLLADLMQSEDGPPVFSGWLHGKTGGNPFFALETLKALFENGVLRTEGREWHTDLDEMTQDYSELQVPPKVAEVVQRRVGRLSEPALRVVQAASVVGEGFTPKLLSSVSGLSEWAALDGVEEVVNSGMIAGSRFAHDLIRQGVYGSLQEQRRLVLHTRVAEELQGKAEAALVAEHWFAAGQKAQAVAQWQEAASQSVDAPTSVRLLERAIQANQDAQLAPELELKLAEVLGGSGRYEESYQRVLALAERPLPIKLRAWVLTLQAGYYVQTMNTAKADPILAELERDYPAESLEERARILFWLLKKSWHFQRGEFAQALGVAQQLAAEYAKSGDPHTRFDLALLKNDMGAQLTQMGRFEEAQLEIEQALELARQVGSRHARISCMSNLVYHWIARKDPARVLDQARKVLAEDPDYLEGRTDNLEVNIATACLKLERWSEAIHHYEQVRSKARHPMFSLLSRVRLIALYHQTGQLEEANQAIEQALVLVVKTSHAPARALLLTNVLLHGTPDQIKRVQDLVEPLDRSKLPAEIREQLEEAQNRLGLKH